jgi:hypothetical protein
MMSPTVQWWAARVLNTLGAIWLGGLSGMLILHVLQPAAVCP